jgi:ribosomal protein S26
MTRRIRAVYHGHYNVRDQRGHYVKPKTARGHVCHHSCCNGGRVHPDKLPVQINRSYLRSLTEPQLERELNEYMNYSETHERGMTQIIAELDWRETKERNAVARKARAKERRQQRQQEWQDEVYRQWLMAENATNGYMLNKAGKAKDIDERTLFTGPESRVRAYASPELIEFFESHPRPTRASYLGSTRERRDHLAGRRIG